MYTRLIIFALFLSLVSPSFGQFSMERYLSTAVSEPELAYLNEQASFVEENGFKSPILREVEFRARIRNFGNGFEDYRLRFSPLNPLEKSANKNYRDAVSQQLDAEYRMNLEEVLLRRYQVMTEHYKLSQTRKVLDQDLNFYTELKTVLQQDASMSALRDAIATDKEILDIKLKLEEIASELTALEHTIRQAYPYEGDLSWASDLVAISEIKLWLESLQGINVNNNLYLINELHKVQVTSSELKVKQQESFSNIGYVQAEYRKDPTQTFGENMGMQVGVSLPVTNPDKPDLQRRKLKMLEDSQDLKQDKAELQQYIDKKISKLESLLRQHELISEKLNSYKNKKLTTGTSSSGLKLLLDLHEFTSELEQRKLELDQKIRSSYLQILSFDGKLSSQPYINYLSPSHSPFEMNR